MNSEDNVSFSFLEFCEILINSQIEKELEENNSNSYGNGEGFISRGLPSGQPQIRKELGLQILKKQKRNILIQNIELLKNLIQQKNEDESFIHLAKIINNVATNEQKLLFIRELKLDENSHDNFQIPTMSNRRNYKNDFDYLVSRSAASEEQRDLSLNSVNTNSIGNSLSSTKISPGEQYLICKGVYYCRVLLSKFYREKDKTIINELKCRGILHYVLNEPGDNKKSYLMTLVDQYPSSYHEIYFILKEDEDSILKSSIFVLLAEKNMNQLYDFLCRLSNDKVDKNKLSQSCNESSFNGVLVSHIIRRNNKSEDAVSTVKIETFLNRCKRLPPS